MSLEDIQQANNNYMDIVRAWKSFIYVLFYLIRTTLVKYEYALLMKMVSSLYCSTICNFCNTTRDLRLSQQYYVTCIYLRTYTYLILPAWYHIKYACCLFWFLENPINWLVGDDLFSFVVITCRLNTNADNWDFASKK